MTARGHELTSCFVPKQSAIVHLAVWRRRFTPEIQARVERWFLASVDDFRRAGGGYAIPGEFCTEAGNVKVERE